MRFIVSNQRSIQFIIVALDNNKNVVSTSRLIHVATKGGKAGNNRKVATVSKKGVIKAKGKGKCYVYAYAQNGVFRKIKIIVK